MEGGPSRSAAEHRADRPDVRAEGPVRQYSRTVSSPASTIGGEGHFPAECHYLRLNSVNFRLLLVVWDAVAS